MLFALNNLVKIFSNTLQCNNALIKKFCTKILGIWRDFKELFDFLRIQGQYFSFDISAEK